MEENKHLEPHFSKAFKEISEILLQNYKDISSFGGSSILGNQSNVSSNMKLNNNLSQMVPDILRKESAKSMTSNQSGSRSGTSGLTA